MKKGLLILALAVAAVVALIGRGVISYDIPLVASVVNWYGKAASGLAPLEVVYPGAIREGILTPDQIEQLEAGQWQGLSWKELPDHKGRTGVVEVVAVTPDAKEYPQVVRDCIDQDVKLVIESSGMDAWHATEEGLAGINALAPQALRAVVFDGGHHLPTLGLRPDLLIVPVTMGYAAHSYTRDAMEVRNLIAILETEKIDCPVVTVPRWGLVKTPASMNRIAVRAWLRLSPGRSSSPGAVGRIAGPRSTAYGQALFLYLSDAEKQNPQLPRLETGQGIKRAYVAVNFDSVNQTQIEECLKQLRQQGLRVKLVNEPLQAAGAIIRGGWRCIAARMP